MSHQWMTLLLTFLLLVAVDSSDHLPLGDGPGECSKLCNTGVDMNGNECNTGKCLLQTFKDDSLSLSYNPEWVNFFHTDKTEPDRYPYMKKMSSARAVAGNWKIQYFGNEGDQVVCEGEKIPFLDVNDELKGAEELHENPPDCNYYLRLTNGDSIVRFTRSNGILNKYASKKWNDWATGVVSFKGYWRVYEDSKWGGDYYDICEGDEVSAINKGLEDEGLLRKISGVQRLSCCGKDNPNRLC